jgi:DNA repair protein RadC
LVEIARWALDTGNRETDVNAENDPLRTFVPARVAVARYQTKASSTPCARPVPFSTSDPTPSPDDLDLTRRLAGAGDVLGVPMFDHVNIGDRRYL